MRRDSAGTRAPNVIFVLIDDLGWMDLGCYGSSFYDTPAIDGLASQGMLFDNAYAAAPVCSPTRASILTVKYPATVGLTQYIGGHAVGRLADVPYFYELPMNEYSLARALRDGGYRTWHVGKWHLGGRRAWPDRHGFDVNIAGCEWGHPRSYFSPYQCPTLDDGPPGEYLTDRLTDEAIRLIQTAGTDPFFLNLWHYAVHVPIRAPQQLIERYRAKAESLGLDRVDPFIDGGPMPMWHQRYQRIQRRTVQSDAAYAAMVHNLDWNVGRLMEALDESGKSDNTIVILTSDNGGLATAEGSPTCNLPLSEGKGWLADGGVRVPLLVRWPATIPAGSRVSEPVTSTDFYPTLLDAANLPIAHQYIEGASFLPLLRGESFNRGPIFWHYPHYANQGGTPGAAIRDGDYKLIRFFEDDHHELYNLVTDISERQDLSRERPEEVKRLGGMLDQWLKDVGARIPAPNHARPYDDLPGSEMAKF